MILCFFLFMWKTILSVIQSILGGFALFCKANLNNSQCNNIYEL